MTPRPLLHLEGAAVLVLSLFAYRWNHGGWPLFALLFLVPDVSMLGYLANTRIGAITYNAVHTYIGPLALAGYSIASARHTPLSLSHLDRSHRFRPHAWIRIEVPDSVQGHSFESGSPYVLSLVPNPAPSS